MTSDRRSATIRGLESFYCQLLTVNLLCESTSVTLVSARGGGAGLRTRQSLVNVCPTPNEARPHCGNEDDGSLRRVGVVHGQRLAQAEAAGGGAKIPAGFRDERDSFQWNPGFLGEDFDVARIGFMNGEVIDPGPDGAAKG